MLSSSIILPFLSLSTVKLFFFFVSLPIDPLVTTKTLFTSGNDLSLDTFSVLWIWIVVIFVRFCSLIFFGVFFKSLTSSLELLLFIILVVEIFGCCIFLSICISMFLSTLGSSFFIFGFGFISFFLSILDSFDLYKEL